VTVHQIWKDKRKFDREIRERVSDLIYDTSGWYLTRYSKEWDVEFENIQTKLKEFNKFICGEKLKRKDQHFYINNIYYTCWILTIEKYKNRLMKIEEFKKKYKKEIEYIYQTKKKNV